MSDVTKLLLAIEDGNPQAADQLLPLVYDALRRLAKAKMSQEAAGQTLQATALVHEAYLRLVKSDPSREWNGSRHFYIAAAEAMRRILVENARRKSRRKRGGDRQRLPLSMEDIPAPTSGDETLAINEALSKLEATNRMAAELVKLRYFAGYTIPEVADILGVSARKADQIWAYAKAWLMTEVGRANDC